MAVITQRQRPWKIAVKRDKPAEMVNPLILGQAIKTNACCGTVILVAQQMLWKRRRIDLGVEPVIQLIMDRGSFICGHMRLP